MEILHGIMGTCICSTQVPSSLRLFPFSLHNEADFDPTQFLELSEKGGECKKWWIPTERVLVGLALDDGPNVSGVFDRARTGRIHS